MADGLRQRYVQAVILDASGGGRVSFVMRGNFTLEHMRVVVTGPGGAATVRVPTAMVTVNGDDFEGSQTGNNDQSTVSLPLVAQDEIVCTWTGGDPGATAVMTLRGTED